MKYLVLTTVTTMAVDDDEATEDLEDWQAAIADGEDGDLQEMLHDVVCKMEYVPEVTIKLVVE